MIDAFNRQTTTEFRLNPNEFDLVLARVGEVAGADAISETLASKTSRDERNRLGAASHGVAASDGAGARGWFQSQPAGVQKEMLWPLLTGLSQSDPKQALALVSTETQDVQEKVIPKIVDNAVQLWGFRGAEELLTPLLGRKDIEDGTRGKVFSQLAHRRIEVGQITGDPFEALQWFDKFLDSNAPGPMATTAIISYAAQRDPSATLNWLDERIDKLSNFRGDIGDSTTAQVWAQQDPGKFSAWLEANPDHPQHDRMIEAASGALIQKAGAAEVQRLALTVHDPQIRAKLDGMLKKAAGQTNVGQ